jgi:hypothetical protein
MRARGDYEDDPPVRSVAMVRQLGAAFKSIPRKGNSQGHAWRSSAEMTKWHGGFASMPLTDSSKVSPAKDP